MTGALLALALAASPGLAQEEWEAPPEEAQEEGSRKHLSFALWGGEAWDQSGGGGSADVFGAEVAWRFSQLDVGLAGYQYRGLPSARGDYTPVTMLRLTQRFPLRTGVEATFGLGAGAARVRDWEAWFQVALGVRVPLGPLFLGGELAFERSYILKAAAALGVAF